MQFIRSADTVWIIISLLFRLELRHAHRSDDQRQIDVTRTPLARAQDARTLDVTDMNVTTTSMTLPTSSPQSRITRPDNRQVGCKELRSKRYISDGRCTALTPVLEVVCAGHCLPLEELPWYAEFIKVWSTTKVLEWRCVEDSVRKKKVHLMCQDGTSRTYRVKVVRSCKCKHYMRHQNQSEVSSHRKRKARHRRRRQRQKGRRMRRISDRRS